MKLLKSVLQLKALMKPRKCVHMVICLSEIPTLIYFVSVADALENGASFILLQFLVGMYRVWHSVTVLFLLLAQKFIKKTSHSSGLHSWGFQWRSVSGFASAQPPPLLACFGPSTDGFTQACPVPLVPVCKRSVHIQTSPTRAKAGFSCPQVSLPSSLALPPFSGPSYPSWYGSSSSGGHVNRDSKSVSQK